LLYKVPAFERLRQEELEFKISLDHTERLAQKRRVKESYLPEENWVAVINGKGRKTGRQNNKCSFQMICL
jgi:hypothetical protein